MFLNKITFYRMIFILYKILQGFARIKSSKILVSQLQLSDSSNVTLRLVFVLHRVKKVRELSRRYQSLLHVYFKLPSTQRLNEN